MSTVQRPRPALSIVIPVYDTPAPALLFERISAAVTSDFEVIFVDDASPSAEVWPALVELSRRDARVKAVRLAANGGQQAATMCGLAEARGDVVITMDDDLQHDPRDIELLLAESSHDAVIGVLSESRHSRVRRAGSGVKAVVERIAFGKPRGLRLSSFRLLNRRVVDQMLASSLARPLIPALIFAATSDVVGVPVSHSHRAGGKSGYTPARLARLFGRLLIVGSASAFRRARFGTASRPRREASAVPWTIACRAPSEAQDRVDDAVLLDVGERSE
jgi:hypothetical protein